MFLQYICIIKNVGLVQIQKPLLGTVALCARMQTPLHSSPMLQANYPFFKPFAPHLTPGHL